MNTAPEGDGATVQRYVDALTHSVRQRDARRLLEIYSRITGDPAQLWGSSIVGFGAYHYKYASGREGDAPAGGFSARKAATTVYLADGVGAHGELIAELGECTTGVGCLYIKDLDRVDLTVLETIITDSYTSVTNGTSDEH